MVNLLEERLRSNSNAFEGLLSLIPAKYYYDDKTQEQWKAKKKSKSQLKEDRFKKLDPEQQDASCLSTLKVMKEKEKYAKPVVLPGEKLKQLKNEQNEDESCEEIDEVKEVDTVSLDDNGSEISLNGESEKEEQKRDDSCNEKSVEEKKQPRRPENKPNLEVLRSKLQSKIQAMKEKRKAPGTKARGGTPNLREEIIEERKRKLLLKKRKRDFQKQQNNKSGEESDSDEDESDVETQQTSKKTKVEAEIDPDDVIFQNIEFDDGNKLASDLQHLRGPLKKKGPAKNDLKAHLNLLQAKKSKLESKEEIDQITAKGKGKWQRAMLQAEGVKLKDDEKLLRKALKRKEAKKRRSAQEWKERQLAVKTSKAEKQRRREENLQIRRQNKGVKKSKQQRMKRTYKANPTKVKRAGFEGRLKSGKKN